MHFLTSPLMRGSGNRVTSPGSNYMTATALLEFHGVPVVSRLEQSGLASLVPQPLGIDSDSRIIYDLAKNYQ